MNCKLFACLASLLLVGAVAPAREPVKKLVRVSYEITAFAAGDLNQDSRADLILCDGKKAEVYLQKEAGTFSNRPARTITLPDNNCWSATIYDFDGDGKNDFALAPYHGNLYLYLSGNRFAEPAQKNHNGDQWRASFAVYPCDSEENAIALFTGHVRRRLMADGKIVSSYIYPPGKLKAGHDSPQACDFDYNGFRDYVYLLDGGIVIYYGPLPSPAAGNITPSSLAKCATIPLTGKYNSFCIVDWDGDGLHEILLGSPIGTESPRIRIVRPNRFEGFVGARAENFLAGCCPIAGDFDGDGKTEVAIAAGTHASGMIRIYRAGQRQPFFKGAYSDALLLRAADMNCDGFPEILIRGLRSLSMITLRPKR